MNRTIKFRGKRVDNGEWIYGDLCDYMSGYGKCIMPKAFFATRDFGEKDEFGNPVIEDTMAIGGFIPVIPETVAQFTGLLDKNGKEIYEGDVLKFVGGTCDFVPCGIYDYQHHKKGTILCVQKLLSGYTLCLPNQINQHIPNMVGKADNYFFWNNARSFEVIGNIHDNPELLNNTEQ